MNQDVWPFIMIICLGGMVSGMFKAWMQHREKMAQGRGNSADFEERFGRFEKRLANIESIIVERDRKSQFDEILK